MSGPDGLYSYPSSTFTFNHTATSNYSTPTVFPAPTIVAPTTGAPTANNDSIVFHGVLLLFVLSSSAGLLLLWIVFLSRGTTQETAAIDAARLKEWIETRLLVRIWGDKEGDAVIEKASAEMTLETESMDSIECGDRPDSTTTTTTADEERHDTDSPVRAEYSSSKNDNASNDDDHCDYDCAICMAGINKGDMICESGNPACRHVFHQECMMGWLLVSEHCPVCRQKYVNDDYDP
jgi:hypothetical protein